jgi:pimeloyl-ACP methyl ester carboxylesterase
LAAHRNLVSAEQSAPVGTGVTLCYQTFGDPRDEPLLLVMGLGGPMVWWDEDLCRRLADRGFFVVRFDNRDAGRSTKLSDTVPRGQIVRGFVGRPMVPPYSLVDLASDTIGLMDHLGIASGHIAGLSMGGMIAQTMAIRAPERVRSLTSMMSTTGRRRVGWQHPSLAPTLLAPRAAGRTAYVEASARLWRQIGSPGFPVDPERVRSRAEETYDRGFDAAGVIRQMAAIVSQPDRTEDLRGLTLPAMVIHGKADKMVHVSGGRATAAALRNSELMLIDGLGHDLPPVLFDIFADAVRRTAGRT